MKPPIVRMYASTQTVVFLFLVLLLSLPVQALVDLTKEQIPPATQQLQFKLQFDSAKNPQPGRRRANYIWSTHMKFATNLANPANNGPTLSDGQLYQMGCDAWEEMKANRGQYGLGTTSNKDYEPPGMIALLMVDNEVFISSTVRGPSFLYNLNTELHTEVHRSLRICSATMHQYANPEGNPPTLHQKDAGCAEPMVVSQYYVAHPVRFLPVSSHIASYEERVSHLIANMIQNSDNSKVIAVRMTYKRVNVNGVWTENWGQCTIAPPCGDETNTNWGCGVFVQENRLNALLAPLPLTPYNLQSLGLVSTDQQSLCR